jgi:CRISPR-associated helicase Cas3
MLIVPASASMRGACKKLLEEAQSFGTQDTTFHDVLEGVSKSARYRRTIEPSTGRTGGEGAWIWDSDSETPQMPASRASTPNGFQGSLRKELRIGGVDYLFRYYRPEREQSNQLQFLDDHNGAPGHIARAKSRAAHLADAIAPGDAFLSLLLSTAAHHHDEGKRFPKWQQAFGRPKGEPEIAKLHPILRSPATLGGYRHEWESLRRLAHSDFTAPQAIPEGTRGLWRDLVLHLVGVHHGHLRPSIVDSGFTPNAESGKHNPLRLEVAERFIRLQVQIGRWRLAYLEALLKTADAEGSREIPDEEDDDGT